jgi:hypothetical protein
MGEELSRETAAVVRQEVRGQARLRTTGAHEKKMKLPSWIHSEVA